MRAYFAYYAPKDHGYYASVIGIIPTADFYVAISRSLLDESTAEWEDLPEWSIQTPPTIDTVRAMLLAGVSAGGVPVREWSVEVPPEVYRNPIGDKPVTNDETPLANWVQQLLRAHDGTHPLTGHTIPQQMSKDALQDHLRGRATGIERDTLSSIQLRVADGKRLVAEDAQALEGTESYVRPNGKTYYSRKWGMHTDIEVLRRARTMHQPALLLSPPGTGKTAAIEAAFGEDLFTVVGSGNTEEADLVGTYVANPDGSFTWHDGPLVRAAEEGKVLFLDEVGLIDAKVLSVVYPLMDGRDEIEILANPSRGTIKAAEGFFVVAATNPKAPGVRMSEALLSRFTLKAHMTTDYKMLETVIGVNAAVCRVASNLAVKLKEGEVSWAPQFRELQAFHAIEAALGTRFALANMLTDVPEHDLDEVTQALAGSLGESVEVAEIV